ncbi:MAG: ATP-binding protein [Bdellovibrionota bacterium]
MPTCFRGDAGRLLQVLLNLLNNAIKFTEKGHVDVSVTCPRQNEHGAQLRFEISDTGIGMSPDTLTKLFTPFTQADGSTTRKFGGTGLGLSISKKLIELMGGAIMVRSMEGKGSSFSFELKFPFGDREKTSIQVQPELERAPRGVFRGKHVLVAEDNIASQKVLLRFLGKLGIRADAVANGAEAVRSFQQKHYDQILMDCQMPELDGYAATRKIREIELDGARPRTTIIALTAHAFASGSFRMIRKISLTSSRSLFLLRCLPSFGGHWGDLPERSS